MSSVEPDAATIERLHLEAVLKAGTVRYDFAPYAFVQVWPSGAQIWMRDMRLHRESGPAIDADGRRDWYRNGVPCNPDGSPLSEKDTVVLPVIRTRPT